MIGSDPANLYIRGWKHEPFWEEDDIFNAKEAENSNNARIKPRFLPMDDGGGRNVVSQIARRIRRRMRTLEHFRAK